MADHIFSRALCMTSAVIAEVCTTIVKYVGPEYLSLSKHDKKMREKISEFESKFRMIQAFGCVDCTQESIICLTEYSNDYYCYKLFYLLNTRQYVTVRVTL